MSVFNSGDRIGVIKNGKVQYGNIVKFSWNSLTKEEEYVVHWDNGVKETYDPSTVDKDWFRLSDWDKNVLGVEPKTNDIKKAGSDARDAINYMLGSSPWIHQSGIVTLKGIESVPIEFVVDIHGNKVKQCNHKFVPYHGLIDSFEYCVYCDEKKRN